MALSVTPLSPSSSSSIPFSYSAALAQFYDQKDPASFFRCKEFLPQIPQDEIIKLISFIAEQKLFQCAGAKDALLLLEPALTRDLLETIGNQLFSPTDGRLQEALWWGVYTSNHAAIEQALQGGAKINQPLYPGMSALLLSCKQGDPSTAELLLKEGANSRFIGGAHHHQTPLSEALLREEFKGSSVLQHLVELDGGFSDEFHARKRLAQEYSQWIEPGQISSLEGIAFYLEGYRPKYVFNREEIRDFYQEFKEQLLAGEGPILERISAGSDPEVKEMLEQPLVRENMCRAFEEMLLAMQHSFELEKKGVHHMPGRMQAELKKRMEDGKPLVLFGVTRLKEKWITGAPNSHAWGLVITLDKASNDYSVYRCNRGHGAASREGIARISLSHEEIIQLIDDYTRAIDWKRDVFQIGRTIQDVEAKVKAKGKIIISQTSQKIGNCCYYSAQSIELALLSALLEPLFGEGSRVLAKTIKNERSNYVRQADLKKYIIKHMQRQDLNGADLHLLTIFYSKIESNSRECLSIYAQSCAWQQFIRDRSLKLMWRKLSEHMQEFEVPALDASTEEIRQFLNHESNQPLLGTITCLNLSSVNLFALPEEICRLTNLENLIAQGCSLKSIPGLTLPKLKYLNLHNNHLASLPPLDLPQLKSLTVSANYLEEISPELALPSLEGLYLNENNLSEIPSTLCFPELVTLQCGGNKFRTLPRFHFPRLVQDDAFKINMITTFFNDSRRKDQAGPYSDELITALIALFCQIEDPLEQAMILNKICGSAFCSRDTANRFFEAVSPERMASVLGDPRMLFGRTMKAALIREYIQAFFLSVKKPLPLLSLEQIDALVLLFQATELEDVQEEILEHIVEAQNSAEWISRRFSDALNSSP